MINLIDKTAIDENRILELAEQYIYNILPDKEDVNNRLAFSGVLRYIYSQLFKPSDYDICINNQNSKIPYNDIISIQTCYNTFIDLCCKYKKEYTVNSFSAMSGIDTQCIRAWKDGKRIPDYIGNIPTNAWQFFAEKVFINSEQALSESMLQGNLMAYAQLKCWYGWQETPQTQQITISGPQQNASAIAQKYNFAALVAPPQENNFSGFQNTQENIVQVSGNENSFLSPGNN